MTCVIILNISFIPVNEGHNKPKLSVYPNTSIYSDPYLQPFLFLMFNINLFEEKLNRLGERHPPCFTPLFILHLSDKGGK